MPDKKLIILALKKIKPTLEKKYGVKDLAIFGSYSRNDAVDGESDIDILVDFTEPIGLEFVSLADELEKLLQLKVDLVSREGIKPRYFAVIQPDLIYV